MKPTEIAQDLKNNSYPGRGIVLGAHPDGKHAVMAYFIMGRSENSRNRVFVTEPDGIRTQAFDPAKLTDPSLIIYHPVRTVGNDIIVTNGDQTDTVRDFLLEGKSFTDALRTRTFEPDAPNFTPRISGMAHFEKGGFSYSLSILKSNCHNANSAQRFFYEYEAPVAGEGHFIHTYDCDGDPIPSFRGEPKRIAVEGDIDAFTALLWENLNEENKVSLYTCYIDLESGAQQTRIVNKNK